MSIWDTLESMVDWINPMLSGFYRLVTQPIFLVVVVSITGIVIAIMLTVGVRSLMVMIIDWIYGV